MELASRAGRVRWGILAMLFFVTVINYADRATLSLAAPALTDDLGISPLQLGIVFSAFGWAYVAAQIPGGWLLDRMKQQALLVGLAVTSSAALVFLIFNTSIGKVANNILTF